MHCTSYKSNIMHTQIEGVYFLSIQKVVALIPRLTTTKKPQKKKKKKNRFATETVYWKQVMHTHLCCSLNYSKTKYKTTFSVKK